MGSPRDSGEEADSFLCRSTSGTCCASASAQPVSPLLPGAAPPHIVGSTELLTEQGLPGFRQTMVTSYLDRDTLGRITMMMASLRLPAVNC